MKLAPKSIVDLEISDNKIKLHLQLNKIRSERFIEVGRYMLRFCYMHAVAKKVSFACIYFRVLSLCVYVGNIRVLWSIPEMKITGITYLSRFSKQIEVRNTRNTGKYLIIMAFNYINNYVNYLLNFWNMKLPVAAKRKQIIYVSHFFNLCYD